MAISTLLQEGFVKSDSFNVQVSGVVKRQALSKANAWKAKMTPQMQQLLSNVVRQPSQYGFASTIVADAAWAVTYDGWAADPNAAEGAILAAVEAVWVLLTGIVEPPDPEVP